MPHDEKRDFSLAWARFGLVFGVVAGICYFYRFSRRFLELPDVLDSMFWFMFGPCFAIFSVGLYHLMRLPRDRPSLQAAAFFNASAGVLVTAMFLVQSATFTIGFRFIRAAGSDELRDLAYQIMNTVNAAQLGLGMAWDIFVSMGTVLFGVAMLRDRRFGFFLGALGIGLATIALLLNFWTFPTPPAEAGLIDLGPGIGIWYLLLAVPIVAALRAESRDPAANDAK